MKGGPPAPQLAGEISTEISLFHGAETMYLQAWELFGAGATVVNAVGFIDGIRLRNPSKSGVIAVITKAAVSVTINSSLNMFQGPQSADLGSVGTLFGLDSRGRAQPSCQFTFSTNPPIFGTNIGTYNEIAGTTLDLLGPADEIPLLPGTAWQITTTVQNLVMQIAMRWRERALEESELT